MIQPAAILEDDPESRQKQAFHCKGENLLLRRLDRLLALEGHVLTPSGSLAFIISLDLKLALIQLSLSTCEPICDLFGLQNGGIGISGEIFMDIQFEDMVVLHRR